MGAHDVGLGALELADLEADGDSAVDARLREVDAAIGIDRFDKREVEIVKICVALAAIAEGEERVIGFGDDLETRRCAQLFAKCARPGDVIADHRA